MRETFKRNILLRDFAAENYLGLDEEAIGAALHHRNALNDIYDHIRIFRLRKALPTMVYSGGRRSGPSPRLTKDQVAISKVLTELEKDKGERSFKTLPSFKCQLFHGSPIVGPFIDLIKLAGVFTNIAYKGGQLRADLVLHETPAGHELRERYDEARPTVSIVRWGTGAWEGNGYGFVVD